MIVSTLTRPVVTLRNDTRVGIGTPVRFHREVLDPKQPLVTEGLITDRVEPGVLEVAIHDATGSRVYLHVGFANLVELRDDLGVWHAVTLILDTPEFRRD